MTDMDRLIEAVRQAICVERCACYGDPPCNRLPDFKGCESDERCEGIARAAVLATLRGIREPSAEMIGTAGATVLNRYVGKDPAEHYYGTAGWAHETYTAMIDQAIKEAEG